MADTDDMLSDLLAKNAALFAAYGEWSAGQIMLLAGTVDDPSSFDKDGGKTGALGYYPVVNVSGQTLYIPCIARLKEIALGGANAETLAEILGTANTKLALVDQATAEAAAARDQANTKAAYAAAQGDFAKAQGEAIGDISAAVGAATSAGNDAKAALQQLVAAEPMLLDRANHTGTQPITANTETADAKIMTAAERAVVATREVSGIRFAYGKRVAQAGLDQNYRAGWIVTDDGMFYAKLAVRVGIGNGLALARGGDGYLRVSLGTVEGQLPLSAGGDMIDTTAARYLGGQRVARAIMGSGGGAGLVITDDGYIRGKLGIKLTTANGMTMQLGGDGITRLAFGSVEGQLPLGAGGDVIDTTATRYLGGQRVLRGVTDKDGRYAWAVTADGYLRGKLGVRLMIGNGLTLQLGADGITRLGFGTVEGQLPLGNGGDSIDTRSTTYIRGRKLLRGIVDSTGLLSFGVLADGTVYIPKLLSDSTSSIEKLLDCPGYVFDTMMVAGKRQIFCTSKTTGVRAQITFGGNNDNVRLSDDKSLIVYVSDRNGTSTSYYQPIGGGLEHPVFPRRGLVGAGDSLTFGTGSTNPATDAIVAQVAAHYGLPFTNLGRPGATAPEIAGFVGAADPLVTVANNQIVAGSNSITLDIPFLSANGGTGGDSQKRTIAGIVGTVAKAGGAAPDYTGTYTFTPDSGQTLPVACPAGTPALLAPNTNSEKIAIIRVGRNNVNGAAFDKAWSDDAFARTQQLIAWLKPLVKNFVVLPVPNGNYSTENSGGAANPANPSPGAGYLALMAHNARLKAAWPDNFLDDRALIVAAYNPSLSQDVTDHANDVPPTSLRADNVHWTTAGYAISAAAIWAFIDAKGWLTNPLLAPFA